MAIFFFDKIQIWMAMNCQGGRFEIWVGNPDTQGLSGYVYVHVFTCKP